MSMSYKGSLWKPKTNIWDYFPDFKPIVDLVITF